MYMRMEHGQLTKFYQKLSEIPARVNTNHEKRRKNTAVAIQQAKHGLITLRNFVETTTGIEDCF